MRKSGRLFIVLGVALALVAAALAIVAFSGGNKNNKSAQQPAVAPVVVATRNIAANAVITQDDVQIAQVTKTTIAPGAASASGQVVGLAASGAIVKGQQILSANLSAPGLSFDVSNGKLAVALPVDRVNSLGGMIRSGDHIDLIYSTRVKLTRVLPTDPVEVQDATKGYANDNTLTLPPPPGGATNKTYPYPGDPGSRFTVQDNSPGDPTTKLIVQNLQVLQVIAGNVTVGNTDTSGSGTGSTNASGTPTAPQGAAQKLPNADLLVLEVDPQQAEVIKFLEDNGGQYQVALRSKNDNGAATTTGVTYDQLVTEYGLPVPKTVRLPGGGQ